MPELGTKQLDMEMYQILMWNSVGTECNSFSATQN